jgi:predicted small lipoprotein YifL
MIRKITIMILVAAMAAPLAGCGRKGKPLPPEGSAYPRNYPEITFPEANQAPPENQ